MRRMKRLHRAGLGVLACLLVTTAGTVPLGAGAAPASNTDLAVSEKPPKNGERRYLYRASFTAMVNNNLALIYPGPSNDDVRALSAAISETHPAVEMSTADRYAMIPRSTKSTVTVQSATLSTTDRTNDGQYVQTCSSDSAEVSGPASPVPNLLSGSDFLTFTSLVFTASCTDTLGASSTAKYFLPPMQAEIGEGSGKVGDPVRTFDLHAVVGTPPFDSPAECPSYAEGPNNTCSYAINGTLTLKLIKEVKPPKGANKGASVTKGAKKAVVQVQCPLACRMEIEVMPLRGSTRVLTRDNLSLRPSDDPTTVSLAIPAKNRAAAVKAGGVRIKLTYRIPGMPPFTQTREAFL